MKKQLLQRWSNSSIPHMNRSFLKIAFLIGALSVILGAFGAHALKDKLDPDLLNAYETGVRYQFYHAFALIAVGVLYAAYSNQAMKWAGYFFIAGIILFSGSLYLLCLTGHKWIGAITPIGGAAFIAGWIFGLYGIMKPRRIGEG